MSHLKELRSIRMEIDNPRCSYLSSTTLTLKGPPRLLRPHAAASACKPRAVGKRRVLPGLHHDNLKPFAGPAAPSTAFRAPLGHI